MTFLSSTTVTSAARVPRNSGITNVLASQEQRIYLVRRTFDRDRVGSLDDSGGVILSAIGASFD